MKKSLKTKFTDEEQQKITAFLHAAPRATTPDEHNKIKELGKEILTPIKRVFVGNVMEHALMGGTAAYQLIKQVKLTHRNEPCWCINMYGPVIFMNQSHPASESKIGISSNLVFTLFEHDSGKLHVRTEFDSILKRELAKIERIKKNIKKEFAI